MFNAHFYTTVVMTVFSQYDQTNVSIKFVHTAHSLYDIDRLTARPSEFHSHECLHGQQTFSYGMLSANLVKVVFDQYKYTGYKMSIKEDSLRDVKIVHQLQQYDMTEVNVPGKVLTDIIIYILSGHTNLTTVNEHVKKLILHNS